MACWRMPGAGLSCPPCSCALPTSVSLGTSGVVAAVSATPTHDPSGLVTGFADATGVFLPLACTLNGARVLDAAKKVLGVSYDEFDEIVPAAEPGAGGLVHVPYLPPG